MDNKAEIKEIVLTIGKREIRLTPEECKKLKATLEEIFGKEIVQVEKHVHHDHYHDRWYYYPSYVYPTPVYPTPTIYCTASGSNIAYTSSSGTLSIDCSGETVTG